MKKTLFNTIAFLLVYTDFPPFRWFYSLVAKIAIKIAVFILIRGGLVKSVYLIRGFARGEEVFGQSDIDLLVVTENNASVPTIINRYRILASLFPLFDKVHGVASHERLKNLYCRYDICKFRYNIDVGHWKLLYGKEIRENFSELLVGLKKELSLSGELCKLWSTLIDNIYFRDFPRFKTHYFLCKFRDELIRILENSTVKPETVPLSESLKKNSFSHLLAAGAQAIDEWSHRISQHFYTSPNLPSSLEIIEDDLFILDETYSFLEEVQFIIKNFCSENSQGIILPQILNPNLSSILYPRAISTPLQNPFFDLCVDNICFYFFPPEDWDVKLLKEMTRKLKSTPRLQKVNIYMAFSHTHFSLNKRNFFVDVFPSVQNPLNSPFEFLLLRQRRGKTIAARAEFPGCPLEVTQPLLERFSHETGLIRQVLSEPLDENSFIERTKLIFYAIQVHFFLEGLRKGVLDFPLTSRGLSLRLSKSSPETSGWVNDLQHSYEKTLQGRNAPTQKRKNLLKQAFSYAKRLYEDQEKNMGER